MNKLQDFTREQVLEIILGLLDRPDILLDAIQNENTDWDSESLLILVESDLKQLGNENS